MTAIVVVAALTLGASFLCSLLEAALYSVSLTKLEVMVREGVFGAERFRQLRLHVDAPIAAILTVNTIAHTVGAMLLGLLVGTEYGDAAVGIFTAVFTLMVLLLTEIVPKSIGVKYGPDMVSLLAWPLQLMIWVSWPIARSCSWLMRKLTGRGQGDVPSEAEIIAMSKAAGRKGELRPIEATWVENVLLLDQVSAASLMTPRTVVKSVAVTDSIRSVHERSEMFGYSRLPVTSEPGAVDKLVGFIHRHDVQVAVVRGDGDRPVEILMRPLEFVPGAMKGPQLLERFIEGRTHMLAVVDEYGGVDGIVTLEDVLESMLGAEIVDEHDQHVDLQQVARDRARRRARADRT